MGPDRNQGEVPYGLVAISHLGAKVTIYRNRARRREVACRRSPREEQRVASGEVSGIRREVGVYDERFQQERQQDRENSGFREDDPGNTRSSGEGLLQSLSPASSGITGTLK